MSRPGSNAFPRPTAEVFRLLEQLCHGKLTEAEGARLEQLVVEDTDARRCYVRYLHLHAMLPWVVGVTESSQDALVFPGNSKIIIPEIHLAGASDAGSGFLDRSVGTVGRVRITLRALIGTTAAVAAVLYGLFAGIAWDIPGKYEARRAAALDAPASDFDPARIARATSNATAQASDATPGRPFTIPAGRLDLTLTRGAAVTIQGPAEWMVLNDNRIRLTLGRLFAVVPPRAKGFAVETPGSEIVDLGTEFGVTVAPSGHTEARVFKGLIEVQPAEQASRATNHQPPTRQRLSAGEAISIAPSGLMARVAPEPLTPEEFCKTSPPDADPLPPAQPRRGVQAPPPDGLQLWLTADTGVIEEEVTPGKPRVVRWKNLAMPGDPNADLVQGSHASARGMSAVPAFDAVENGPITAVAQIAGQEFPVVRFDGTDYLQNLAFENSDSFTAYLVVRRIGDPGKINLVPGYTPYHSLLLLGAAGFNEPGMAVVQLMEWQSGVAQGNGVGTLGAYFSNRNLQFASHSYPRLMQERFQIVELRKNNVSSGLVQFFVDGVFLAQHGGTQTVGKGLYLGGWSFGALHGDIAEVLLYRTALGAEDRELVEGLLAWKYGLQASLPREHLYARVDPRTKVIQVGK